MWPSKIKFRLRIWFPKFIKNRYQNQSQIAFENQSILQWFLAPKSTPEGTQKAPKIMKNRFPADSPELLGRLLGKRHRNIAKSDPKRPPTAPKVNQNATQSNKKLTWRQKATQALRTILFFTLLLLILLLFGFVALRPTTLRHNYAKTKGRRGPRSVYNLFKNPSKMHSNLI